MNIDRPSDNPWLYAAFGALAVLCFGAGLGLGYYLWGRAPAPEAPAPAQRQADGSLEVARHPELPMNLPPAPHAIPKDAHEVRRVAVTIQPTAQACPEVRLKLSLVESGKGGSRVIASSPDGRVTGGLDIPVSGPRRLFEPQRPFAAGISYAGEENAFGVFIHGDAWRVRAGLEINATRDDRAEVRVLVGWLW